MSKIVLEHTLVYGAVLPHVFALTALFVVGIVPYKLVPSLNVPIALPMPHPKHEVSLIDSSIGPEILPVPLGFIVLIGA